MITSSTELTAIIEELRRSGIAMGTDALHYVTETESLIEQAYNGRSIFELIQNARDASQLKGEDGVIRFQLADGVLSATNTGNPFSAAGIKAISRVGRSDKHSAETIGFKGLGFKSVRQLTDTPQVVTAYGSIQFDAEMTRQQYGSLDLDELPLFLLPYFAPRTLSEEELAKSVATKIELPLRDAEAEQWVYRNFQELHIRQLLFLGRIRELHFTSAKLNKSFQLTTNGAFLEGQVNGQVSQRFWLFTPEAGIDIPLEITNGLSKKEKAIVSAMKEADVRVALEVGAGGKFKPVKEAPLHLFYPLKTLTGFRFLIHSYFLVNPERTALREDTKLNTFLLKQIGAFIGETICEQLKEAEWDTCEVLYYVRQPQPELLPLYNSLQASLKQQAFIYFEGTYYKPEEVMTINPKLANGLPLQRVNEKQLVVVASPEIRKWLWEEFKVKELEAEALPATLEGACRRGLVSEDWGFFTELYQFLSTKDAPDMTGQAVLLTEHGALVDSKNVEVFYLDNPQDALQLPASLQNQVQLLHSRFQFNSQLGFLQSKTGLRSYERASLAGALLREMGPQKSHNWEILRVLYGLHQVVVAVDFQRDGWLPTSAGTWVRPWARPVYKRSDELVQLYPQGRFLDEAVFEQLDLSEEDAQQGFLSWAGVWQRPGLYIASDEQVVAAGQKRYKLIVSSGSPTIKLINDRVLDVPSRLTSWFSQLLLVKWSEYQYFIRQETGARNIGLLYNNATRMVQQPQRSTWSGAVEWLQNQAWLWLEGDVEPRRVRDVVIGPEGVSEADQLSLAYLPMLELPASVFHALNLDLDLVTWQAGSSSSFVRVLQLFYEHNATTLNKLSATGKAKLLKAYNRLLSRLYEYCANRNSYQLSGLEHTKFLAVDMLTQQLSWCNSMAIYYVDDRGLYELLPQELQARLQPQFTKTEPNQFGKIAKNYGIDISTVVSVEVVAGQVQQEQTAWDIFGETLLDCLSILDAKLAEQLTEAEAHQLLRFPIWQVHELRTAFRWEEETETAEILVEHAVGEDAANTIGLYLKQDFQIQHSLRASKALVSIFARLLPTKNIDWSDVESTLTDYLELENKERFMKRHGDPQRRQELRYLLLGEDDRSPATFWQAARRAIGLPDLSEWTIYQAGIPELTVDLGLPADRLSEFASECFRYEQLSAPGNRKALQWLLKTLSLPLTTLQTTLGEQLNVEMLWGNEWARLKRQYKPAFREWLYDRLQAAGSKATGMQQQSYRYWLLTYDELSARPYPPELTESLLAHFRTKLQEMLPALANAGELTVVGARSEQWYLDKYREARQKLQTRIANEEQEWLTEFLQDSQRDSLLYFGEVALLAKQFETWAQSRRQAPPVVEAADSDPLQLFQNLTNVYGGKFTMRATAAAPEADPAAGGESSTDTGYSVSGAAMSSAHAETGCIAEQWVYAWLQQHHESVRWTSFNAVSVGAAHPWYNPEGSDSLGYDLTYWDADLEEEIWVEVKSTTGNRLSFFISRKELAVAAQRGPHYKLFYVTQALSKEQACIYDLDNPFPDGMKSIVENPHFVAEWEKVRISFTGKVETPISQPTIVS
jgi:hypothetical protein